ncbi:uncharacterized protein LOC111049588 isoform X1 [Nilaparvata lugens]|uniref:uncharacterized protein LOC111049588 isoform X1 n=1 Tax=Nilaparvata lugens TaxID=108931 RepID=UPI00193CEF03|nr:uncharacterized protein LOC111049588 isoform X1 [Nilaparvata lugens]
MSELLISEVQKHPSLWNLNHPQYHNRLMSDRLWASVADELNMTNMKKRRNISLSAEVDEDETVEDLILKLQP